MSKYALLLLIVCFEARSLYAAQTLEEQIQAVDYVAHVQVISGQVLQFEQMAHDHTKPEMEFIAHRTCGFSYQARIIESFKGNLTKGQIVSFSAIESFSIGSEKLLFLSEKSSALSTDVISMVASVDYNNKLDKCKKNLPKLKSHHLSTASFLDENRWIQTSEFDKLPENIYQSPYMKIKANDFDSQELKWNEAPSQDYRLGKYARWHEFKVYLKEVVDSLESK